MFNQANCIFVLCIFKGNVLVKNVIYRQYKIFLSCFKETLHVKSNSGIELSAIKFVFLAVRLIMQKLTGWISWNLPEVKHERGENPWKFNVDLDHFPQSTK